MLGATESVDAPRSVAWLTDAIAGQSAALRPVLTPLLSLAGQLMAAPSTQPAGVALVVALALEFEFDQVVYLGE